MTVSRTLLGISLLLLLTLVSCSTKDESDAPSTTDLNSLDPYANGVLPTVTSVNEVTCEPSLQASENAEVSYLDLNVSNKPDNTGLLVSWKPLKGAASHVLFVQKGNSYFRFTVDECQSMSLSYNPSLVDAWSGYGCDRYSSWFKKGETLTLTLSAGTEEEALERTGARRSTTVTIGDPLLSPPALSGTFDGSLAQLSWNPVTGASAYEVFKVISGEPTSQGTTSSTEKEVSASDGDTFLVQATASGIKSAYSNPLTVHTVDGNFAISIDNLTILQAVEVGSRATSDNTTLITGKPGVVRAFFNITGPDVGQPGVVKLSSGSNSLELTGPLLNTPYATSQEASCVATFDLRDTAARWFQTGVQNFTVTIDNGTSIDNSSGVQQTQTQSFEFEEQVPLYVKLVPVSAADGVPSVSEMNVAKVEIGLALNAIYPNHSITFDVSSTPYSYPGTASTRDAWEEILSGFNNMRTQELNNQNCNRFYYGLIKNGTGIGGLAYINSPGGDCNSRLSGIGLVKKQAVGNIAAHELGHNHGRKHVDHGTNPACSDITNTDDNYPNATAHTDSVGYDFFKHRLMAPSTHYDIMSYCDPAWVSDYTYRNLRAFQEQLPASSASAAQVRVASDGGWLLTGKQDESQQWSFSSLLFLENRRETQASSRYQAVVTRQDGSAVTLPVQLTELDHLPRQHFSVWIPGSAPLQQVVIQNETGVTVFEQSWAAASQKAPAQSASLTARPLGEEQWELSAWDQGPRLVIRLRGEERQFVGNDSGTASLTLEARSGDVLEVRGTTTGALRKLTLP